MLMSRKLLPKILTLAASLSLPTWVVADDNSSIFDQLDTNKDGVVSVDEVPEDKRRLFEKVLKAGDKDNDGKLTREEFAAVIAARDVARDDVSRKAAGPREGATPREGGERKTVPNAPGERGERRDARPEGRPEVPVERPDPAQVIQRLDTNGDGKISKEEAQGPIQEHFARLDANSDGFVDAEELRQGFEKMSAARGISRTDRDRVGGERRFEGAPPREARGPFPVGPLMMVIDTNKDGELSVEEIVNASANLGKLDKDGDGKISREELLAAMGRPVGEGNPAGPRDGDRPAGDRPAGVRNGDRPAGDGPPREGRREAAPDNGPRREAAPRDPAVPRESR